MIGLPHLFNELLSFLLISTHYYDLCLKKRKDSGRFLADTGVASCHNDHMVFQVRQLMMV